jgi:hypothetical protein
MTKNGAEALSPFDLAQDKLAATLKASLLGRFYIVEYWNRVKTVGHTEIHS